MVATLIKVREEDAAAEQCNYNYIIILFTFLDRGHSLCLYWLLIPPHPQSWLTHHKSRITVLCYPAGGALNIHSFIGLTFARPFIEIHRQLNTISLNALLQHSDSNSSPFIPPLVRITTNQRPLDGYLFCVWKLK